MLEFIGQVNPLFAVKAFIAFFVIIDVFAVIPVFISLFEGYSEKEKHAMLVMSIRVAVVALVILTFAGNPIFKLLGIELFSFRIAGGIILLIISIEMLFGKKSRMRVSENLEVEGEDIAITPLAIPLLTGPGAITTGILLFEEAGCLANKAVLVLDILLVFFLTYKILSSIDVVYKILGRLGTKVLTRRMGLMLAAISVQFIISGIFEAVRLL